MAMSIKQKNNAAQLSPNSSSLELDSISDIHVSKAQNFILVLTQNNIDIRAITKSLVYFRE